MAGISGVITSRLVGMLIARGDGVDARVAAIEQGSGMALSPIRAVIPQNASVDNSERGGHARYPALCVYCEKLSNTLREKFRRFSGKAVVVVEVRHSQDHLDDIESHLQVYVDAVCALLDDSRGDWGDGSFYPGGYDVTFEAAGRGGKNFLQKAKVKFEVEVSK